MQRSISARLMSADQIPMGEEIWVEDAKEVWVLTQLVSQQNTQLKVKNKATGEVVEIDLVS